MTGYGYNAYLVCDMCLSNTYTSAADFRIINRGQVAAAELYIQNIRRNNTAV